LKEEEAGGPEAIEKRLRASVKDAFFINVLSDNPIAPKESQQFDCITTGGVFESVSPDRETYKKMCQERGDVAEARWCDPAGRRYQ
jgi:hypothetical protein